MNYIITRIILLAIILIILVVSRKNNKNIENRNINFNVKFILGFIMLFSILFVPFENSFVKYKTIEDNVNYFFPKFKIKEKFVYDDFAYILLKSDKEIVFTYLIKENNSWKLNNLFTKNQGNFSRIEYNISAFKTNIPDKESRAVMIICNLPKTRKNEINDSILSNIYTYNDSNESTIMNTYINIIILNGQLNEEEYTIYLNNKEYQPFKRHQEKKMFLFYRKSSYYDIIFKDSII